MLTDKEQKKEFKKIASKNPEKYYAVEYLKKEGFLRKQCSKCSKFFWSVNNNQDVCGDSSCSGGFRFIGNTPAKNKLSYIDVWKEFSSMFKKLGYVPIHRYPVVARWNPTTDFTIASISAFQPFVVSGEVKPPASSLVIPQFCLRFVDIDNIGITGAHNIGFVMIGQHQFVTKKEWNQNKVFGDIHNWLKKGLGLPDEEITFHEDAWAGGGNFGPCMEFFSRGVEIGNQVYMMYEQTSNGNKELDIKVLDMGMGQERCAWFSQGCATIYDATFPKVMKTLYKISGLEVDEKLMARFIPYASYLNVDEVEDLEKAWKEVAKNVGIDADELKKRILPLSALYSIGEHSRALLFALNDGGLPSNVGGGYNLRILARRCFDFIEKYGWKINLFSICEEHTKELKQQYPELLENLDEVKKILNVEKIKYDANKQKARVIVDKIVKDKEKIDTEKLIDLYDSNGISPDTIKSELAKVGVNIKIPDNFYLLVTTRHEHKEQEHQTKKEEVLNLDGILETKALYFDNYKLIEFKGKVLKIIGNKVILDQTIFYPTSGGQLHDIGNVNGIKVVDVFKQGKVIIHVLGDASKFKVGETVSGKINFVRRLQLAQHHTSTHIVNAAARKVLGKHVNQAGAKKTVEKAHIDITHYQSLTEEELKNIEDEANKIVKQSVIIKKSFMPREEAEKKYGFTIYQGGVPIGHDLRIINIVGVDVEACGGTHLDNTKEAEKIKILKSTKVSDSIVRIEFVAGKAAFEEENKDLRILNELAVLLNCERKQIPERLQELFNIWKNVVKKGKTLNKFQLTSTGKYEGDLIEKSVEILKTQPEHLVNTVKRFIKEINEKINR
ncbi:alanine--tRNA ligase [Candidatus Woesearchaeota archaeon]|nr:alanine--tRNA ligase [Candidatus Woesearchaeota archaeon]